MTFILDMLSFLIGLAFWFIYRHQHFLLRLVILLAISNFFKLFRLDVYRKGVLFLSHSVRYIDTSMRPACQTLGPLILHDFTIQGIRMDVTPVSPEPCPFVIRLSIDGKIVNQLPIVVKDLPDQWTVNGHFQLHAKPCSIQFDIIEIPKGKTIASHEIQTVDLLKDFLLRKNASPAISIEVDDGSSITLTFRFTFSDFEPFRQTTGTVAMPIASFLSPAETSFENLHFLAAAARKVPDEDLRWKYLEVLACINYSLVDDRLELLSQAIGMYHAIVGKDDQSYLPIRCGVQYAVLSFWKLVSQYPSWHAAPTDELRKVTDLAANVLSRISASNAAECRAFWNALHGKYRAGFTQVLVYVAETSTLGDELTSVDRIINLLRSYIPEESDKSYVPHINGVRRSGLQLALARRDRLLHKETDLNQVTDMLDAWDEVMSSFPNGGITNPVWHVMADVLRHMADGRGTAPAKDTLAVEKDPLKSALQMGLQAIISSNFDVDTIDNLLKESLPADVTRNLLVWRAMGYNMRFEESLNKDDIVSGLNSLDQLAVGHHDYALFVELWRVRASLYEGQLVADFVGMMKRLGSQQEPFPKYHTWLFLLRRLPHHVFAHERSPEWVSDATRAIQVLRSGVRDASLPLSERIRLADLWARYGWGIEDPSTEESFSTAFDLLSQITWLQPSLEESYRELLTLNAQNFIQGGTSIAFERQKFDKAIEWLEQGRSVVWQQLFHLRTPHDRLMTLHPDLYKEYVELSRQIESTRFNHEDDPTDEDSREQSYRELQSKQAIAVKKIRSFQGFEDFLSPMRLSNLMAAASGGPVILLTAGNSQCHALILMPQHKDPLHVPLDITSDIVKSLHQKLSDLIKMLSTQDTGYAYVLVKLWVNVGKPILKALATHYDPKLGEYNRNRPTSELPRVWWCPTGPFTMLPLHAAGNYRCGARPGSRLSDYVISSYTPTLNALIQANVPSSSATATGTHVLVVGQSQYSEPWKNLDGVPNELEKVCFHAMAKPIELTVLRDSQATVGAINHHLPHANWVHFACHGFQDSVNPSESALILANNQHLPLSDIIKMSLQHANLAFLSACQTSKGAELLPDESIHLAAGLLLAGFQVVIATMWEVEDCDATQIAGDVYGSLFGVEVPDHKLAAHALHDAVNQLRDSCGNQEFLRWVPYIHIGA